MKSDWIWMPHAGHLAVGSECRFHLNTYLGNGYLVSTVGEWLPDSAVREILAQSRGVELTGRGDARERDWMKKIGFEDIGLNRKYETMVFFAQPAPGSCCPWKQKTYDEQYYHGYNDAEAARIGHMGACIRWSRKRRPK